MNMNGKEFYRWLMSSKARQSFRRNVN